LVCALAPCRERRRFDRDADVIPAGAVQTVAVQSGIWHYGTWQTLLVAAVGEIVGLVFVTRVLLRGRSPSATLSWIVVILVTPWIGLVLYYLMPRRLQMRRLKRRKRRLAWVESVVDPLLEPETPSLESDDPLLRLVHRLDDEALTAGNTVRLLETGTEFFSEAGEAISQAKKHVHFEAYIFRPDSTGQMLLKLLAEAARRGVEVRLLFDALGSWALRKRHLAELRAAGGRAEPSIPLLWRRRPFTFNLRNHRKLLVVDGKLGFLGGRNVGDEYAKDRFGKKRIWLDTMLRIEGTGVSRLQRVFVEDWWNACAEDLALKQYFEAQARGKQMVAVVAGGPDTPTSGLYWTTLQLFSSASSTLDISSPYLVPDATLLNALLLVARRGVRVRIHTNGPSAAHFFVYHAARSYYRMLLEAGAAIWETVGDYNHAKLVLVDGKYCFVGSPNLDARSFELNFEIGAVVIDGPVLGAAQRMFENRCAKARKVEAQDLPTRTYQLVFDGLCKLASPVL
jgi:cardiolipin synthase